MTDQPSGVGGDAPTLSELTRGVDPALRSDKDDRFLGFYEELLRAGRDAAHNILEVGVFRGGALLLLATYFPNARILGVDLRRPPDRFYEELERLGLADRVSVTLASQADRPALRAAITGWFGTAPLDLVIDDASHYYRETRSTFDIVFADHVRPGGMYAIEDWCCGYWPGWPDGHPDGRHGLPRLVKELTDLIALPARTSLVDGERSLGVADELASPISRAIITDGIAVFVRSDAPPSDSLGISSSAGRLDRRVVVRQAGQAVRGARVTAGRLRRRWVGGADRP